MPSIVYSNVLLPLLTIKQPSTSLSCWVLWIFLSEAFLLSYTLMDFAVFVKKPCCVLGASFGYHPSTICSWIMPIRVWNGTSVLPANITVALQLVCCRFSLRPHLSLISQRMSFPIIWSVCYCISRIICAAFLLDALLHLMSRIINLKCKCVASIYYLHICVYNVAIYVWEMTNIYSICVEIDLLFTQYDT